MKDQDGFHTLLTEKKEFLPPIVEVVFLDAENTIMASTGSPWDDGWNEWFN